MGQLNANADRGDEDTGAAKNPGKTVQKMGSKYVEVNLGKTVTPKASALGSDKSVVGTVSRKTKTMGDIPEENYAGN